MMKNGAMRLLSHRPDLVLAISGNAANRLDTFWHKHVFAQEFAPRGGTCDRQSDISSCKD
jgi:hypothetical protein